MIWSSVAHIFSLLIELIQIGHMSDPDKDLEILVLRYQLGIADRKLNRTIKPDRIEKLTLAVLVSRLKSACGGALSHPNKIKVRKYGFFLLFDGIQKPKSVLILQFGQSLLEFRDIQGAE